VTGLGILIFIVFVLIAIGLHEFGHFATAKAFGIKVERFFIGFGPKLWSVKRGETEYGVSAFPLGGYVRIAGMNPLEEIKPEDKPRTFKAKPAWQRAIVLAAGSITHFIVAIIIIGAILSIAGEVDPDKPTTVLEQVGSASGTRTPAERAGLKPDDRLVSVAGVSVRSWSDAQQAIRGHPGQQIQIVVERDGRRLSRTAALLTCVRTSSGERDCVAPYPNGEKTGFLGVSPRFEKVQYSVLSSIGKAASWVGTGMKDSVVAFGKIFAPSNLNRLFQVAIGQEERRIEDPTSIVGIGRLSGDAARSGDFAILFLYIATFNVFIGVVNLLPLPPLDGGHLAVLTYEKIARRDVDMRRLLPITAMVLTIFGMLFVLLLYSDIVNPLPSIPG
jgi:membrane-associated protease RseP (regulator of RpoE activity)